MESLAIRCKSITTRKDNLIPIPTPPKGFCRTKDPSVAAFQATPGIMQIKQCQSQPIQRAGGSLAHAMVNHQPALLSLDGRRRESDLVRVPPCATPGFEHQPMAAPRSQVGCKGYPHVRAKITNRAMD